MAFIVLFSFFLKKKGGTSMHADTLEACIRQPTNYLTNFHTALACDKFIAYEIIGISCGRKREKKFITENCKLDKIMHDDIDANMPQIMCTECEK
jgi:hypothetical protein